MGNHRPTIIISRIAAIMFAFAALVGCGSAMSGNPSPVRISDVERAMVSDYFKELNKAGNAGLVAQRDFMNQAQHPDSSIKGCSLPELVFKIEPALSTLRFDPQWTLGSDGSTPRGTILSVAVTVILIRDGTTIGNQISLLHIVVLNSKIYGFAPCSA